MSGAPHTATDAKRAEPSPCGRIVTRNRRDVVATNEPRIGACGAKPTFVMCLTRLKGISHTVRQPSPPSASTDTSPARAPSQKASSTPCAVNGVSEASVTTSGFPARSSRESPASFASRRSVSPFGAGYATATTS